MAGGVRSGSPGGLPPGQRLSRSRPARATLTTADGEPISDTRERRHLVLSPDGLIEATNFPMFVQRHDSDREVAALFGQSATLECTLTDSEERSAQLAVDCDLAPGTG